MLTAEFLPSPSMFVFVSLPLICIGLPIRWVLRQEWPSLRQSLYFPAVGQVRFEHRRQRNWLLRRVGGMEATVITADNRKVHCVWAPSDDGRSDGPVVILLHANAMVLDDMVDWATFYLQHRVSVMLVTFWGCVGALLTQLLIEATELLPLFRWTYYSPTSNHFYCRLL